MPATKPTSATRRITAQRDRIEGREGEAGAYRLVDGPRLQQRSVKREATTPARRKMTVVTQNPMVGGVDEQSSSRAAAAFSLARWIARSGKRRDRPRGVERQERGEMERGGVAASHVTCFWIAIRLRARDEMLGCASVKALWARPGLFLMYGVDTAFLSFEKETMYLQQTTVTYFLLLQILHTNKFKAPFKKT
jgi:hypothetical protein